MGFPRRRSLWLKVAVLATAVWVTVCFLLYTEDRAAAAVDQGLAPSGVAMPQANGFVPPAAPIRREISASNAPIKARINQAGPEQGISPSHKKKRKNVKRENTFNRYQSETEKELRSRFVPRSACDLDITICGLLVLYD